VAGSHATLPRKRQSETVFEERIIIRVSYVNRNLHHGPQPGKREFARRAITAEQYISNSITFSSRQSGSDETVASMQRFVDDHWPAREQYHDNWNSSLLHISAGD
jgi:hypothetical protein